jgi:putative oxidoreductase
VDLHSIDVGLLILRVGLAFVLFAHATQKLFGWFSGTGLAASAATFERLGQRPGRMMVLVAAASEIATCALVGLGFAWPLGAAVGAGTMLVAGGSVTWKARTVWSARGGGEYPLVLAGFLLGLGFVGPGVLSVDQAVGAPWFSPDGSPVLWGLAGLAVAVLASVPPMLRTVLSPAQLQTEPREDR